MEQAENAPTQAVVVTDIPARLDRLPWGRFHTLVVIALGITWILDGLEVTLAGSLSGALKTTTGLGLSNTEVGLASSAYLAGAVSGALLFGWLTDRLGSGLHDSVHAHVDSRESALADDARISSRRRGRGGRNRGPLRSPWRGPRGLRRRLRATARASQHPTR